LTLGASPGREALHLFAQISCFYGSHCTVTAEQPACLRKHFAQFRLRGVNLLSPKCFQVQGNCRQDFHLVVERKLPKLFSPPVPHSKIQGRVPACHIRRLRLAGSLYDRSLLCSLRRVCMDLRPAILPKKAAFAVCNRLSVTDTFAVTKTCQRNASSFRASRRRPTRILVSVRRFQLRQAGVIYKELPERRSSVWRVAN
jgi:hypothetical protein